MFSDVLSCHGKTNASFLISVMFVFRVLRNLKKNYLMVRNFKDQSLLQRLILCLKVKIWRTSKSLLMFNSIWHFPLWICVMKITCLHGLYAVSPSRLVLLLLYLIFISYSWAIVFCVVFIQLVSVNVNECGCFMGTIKCLRGFR